MTVDEARQILIKNRPDRPKSTERRQLQKAVDVILEALEERQFGQWASHPQDNGHDVFICSNCNGECGFIRKFCPNCGAYMGTLEIS